MGYPAESREGSCNRVCKVRELCCPKRYFCREGAGQVKQSILDRVYYVAIMGNVTEEAIKKYIIGRSEESSLQRR